MGPPKLFKPKNQLQLGLPSSSPVKDRGFSIRWREFKSTAPFFRERKRLYETRKERLLRSSIAPSASRFRVQKVSLGAPYYAGIAKRSNVLASGASGLVPSEVRNTLPFFLCGKKGPVAPQRKTRRDLRSRKVPQCRKSSSPHLLYQKFF